MGSVYKAGIDIGSTTVKLVILDGGGEIIYSRYERHQAHTREVLAEMLEDAADKVGDCVLKLHVTGSGAINISKAMGVPFVQEVVAVAAALKKAAPRTDVAIELGGEDAKIIYFTGGLEERMNGVCAGGTGSFIDQMASLMQRTERTERLMHELCKCTHWCQNSTHLHSSGISLHFTFWSRSLTSMGTMLSSWAMTAGRPLILGLNT